MEINLCEKSKQERKILVMFSENEKISGRQVYRMIVITLLGPTLLICPLIAGRLGSYGFISYIIAGTLSVAYTFFMIRLREIECKPFLLAVRILVCVKLLFLAVGGLYLTCDIVTGILLPETHFFMIIIVLASALIYWNRGSIECLARAFEIMFYWVVVPIVLVLAVAVPKVNSDNLIKDFPADKMVINISGEGIVDIFRVGIILFVLFSPSELLWLCKKHFLDDNKTKRGIWRGLLAVFAGNVVAYGTILGIYGREGICEGATYPLLKVMQISGIPGDFLKRVDGFMSVFLVLSLFCGMVMMMDYLGINLWQICDALFGKKQKRNKTVYSVIVTFIMVIGVIVVGVNVKPGTSSSFIKSAYSDKKIISGTELEDRGFVMSVIIGNDTVTFEMASDEEGIWQEESNYVTIKTDKVLKAEKIYRENGDKKLDFTHMKMIFIEDSIYDDDVTTDNLKYMYEKEKFAENVMVCRLSGDMKKMAAEAMLEGDAFATKIENTFAESEKSQNMELYRVYLERNKK